jgi:uncharacterized protein
MRLQGKQMLAMLAAFLLAAVMVVDQVQARDEIRERMHERLPEIIKLKTEGIIGETSDGLLGYVGEKRVAEELVEAENRDRLRVYAAIAREHSIGMEHVGQRRARQIAEQADPGCWLQDESGNWYQKE